MPTPVLQTIVQNAITDWIDGHELKITQMVEQEEREGLQALLDGWGAR
jgi:hypothetical protein